MVTGGTRGTVLGLERLEWGVMSVTASTALAPSTFILSTAPAMTRMAATLLLWPAPTCPWWHCWVYLGWQGADGGCRTKWSTATVLLVLCICFPLASCCYLFREGDHPMNFMSFQGNGRLWGAPSRNCKDKVFIYESHPCWWMFRPCQGGVWLWCHVHLHNFHCPYQGKYHKFGRQTSFMMKNYLLAMKALLSLTCLKLIIVW